MQTGPARLTAAHALKRGVFTLVRAFVPSLIVGVSSFLLALVFTLALNVLLISIGRDIADVASARVLNMAVIVIFNGTLIVACLLWARWAAPAGWRHELGAVHAPVDGRILLIMLAVMVGGMIWIEFLASMVGRQILENATSGVTLDGGPLARLLTVFAVVVAAPAAEEIFFRGFLQGRLRRGFGPCVAIVIASLAFASVHYNGGILHPLGVLVLSLGCGYLRERTGSLWAPVLLHALNNSLVIASLVIGL